ncbi:hypothetical protein VTK26DRAFT_1015 [Humicola hyalothermophila]
MSQGGSVPRPASGHSSGSPARATGTTSSPPLHRGHASHDDSRTRAPHNLGGLAATEGAVGAQQPESRPPDLRDVPHHPGQPPVLTEQPRHLQQASAAEGSSQQVVAGGRYGGNGSPSRPFLYQSPTTTTPHQANPAAPPTTSSPAIPPVSAGQETPPPVHPYPLAARRILTPKSPRATSLSRAALRTMETQHPPRSLPNPAPRGSLPLHDAPTLAGGPQPLAKPAQLYGALPVQGTTTPVPARPTTGLSRSLSQPSLSRDVPSAPAREPLQSTGLKRDNSGWPVSTGSPFATSVPTSQGFGAPVSFGDGRWAPGSLVPLPAGGPVTRSLLAEGQPLLAIRPEVGEELIVEVDTHQASKQQDEKRQRNAGASARFRQRKKARDTAMQEAMQKLENDNRELAKVSEERMKRIQELEAERDFYRNERNRLRDIIARTPSIRDLADRGPPSPISRTGGPPAPDGNALLTHPPPPAPPSHAQTQPQSHSSPYSQPIAHQHPRSISFTDPSVLGPPARRRRTDSEPQLPSSSYNSMMPTTLPPLTGPPPPSTFGGTTSPHITPPPGAARLPPLRFDQSRTPSTTPPPAPRGPPPPVIPQPTAASSYPTLRSHPPVETGWATDSRGRLEDGAR